MKQLGCIKFIMSCAFIIQASAVFADEVKVQILSAVVKDEMVSDAELILQRNGEKSVIGTTNTQGLAVLKTTFSDTEDTLLIVKKAGYSNLVVKCPCSGMTYAVSPVMENLDGMRIVLNWGASPLDLDSHIFYPNNHIYFSQKNGTDGKLDVDDTTSYGPETITLDRKHDGESYIYAVHDYSNISSRNSKKMSNSGAKIFVYVGQTLIKTYYVPTNLVGNFWTVFEIAKGGEIRDLNTITNLDLDEESQTTGFQGAINNSSVQIVAADEQNKAHAKYLNTKGETAYRTRDYDKAVYFFQTAIENNSNYGQAYSNLGLTFQKLGRVAEALWANRKAIALANGLPAATVRASSHYNNGRIYENSEQWMDALREYRYAELEKSKSIYQKKIQQMIEKGPQ